MTPDNTHGHCDDLFQDLWDSVETLSPQTSSIYHPDVSLLQEQNCTCRTTEELKSVLVVMLRREQDRKSLYSFLYRLLKQYNLLHRYDVDDVINEAYGRALKQINNDQPIHNLLSWFKGAGKNIIREWDRSKKRELKLRDQCIANDTCKINNDAKLVSQNDFVNQVNQYTKNKMDSMIIYFRVIDELSWNQVCAQLIDYGLVSSMLSKQLENRIKQRYHRALKKLPKDMCF